MTDMAQADRTLRTVGDVHDRHRALVRLERQNTRLRVTIDTCCEMLAEVRRTVADDAAQTIDEVIIKAREALWWDEEAEA
jgi:hypothetical protein